MKTQAIWFADLRKAEIREIEVPDPADDEVQVKCLANGICLGDAAIFSGVEKKEFPRMPGHEGIGVVVKAGKNVKKLTEGDIVTCAKWARYYNYKADQLCRFQRQPSDPSTMLAEPVECVVRSIDYCDIVPGDRVLVLGAGFMGLLNVQGLAHCPLSELVVVDLKRRNLELARAFGATRVIQADTESGRKELEELQKRRSFDLVVESVGIQSVIHNADLYARIGGRLAIFAWHHGDRTVDMGRWHLSGLTVLNTSPLISTDSAINYLDRAVKLMERGVFRQEHLVTHRHHFTQVSEAMELACLRPSDYIKGVFLFED
ncbi:MAG: zinc-dependent alcohol dehydrogenase [Kiritimatiellia bacterium]